MPSFLKKRERERERERDVPTICRACASSREEVFDISVEDLDEKFRNLQKGLHPDKFATAPENIRAVAENVSSQINTARKTLKSPLSRAKYMVRMHAPRCLSTEARRKERGKRLLSSCTDSALPCLKSTLTFLLSLLYACWCGQNATAGFGGVQHCRKLGNKW